MDNAQPTAETQIRQHAIALAALAHNGLVFSTDGREERTGDRFGLGRECERLG